jgi:hypothetical protein
MNVARKIWHSIKRNPVVNFFVLTAIGQMSQDYLTGQIDFEHITGYIATVLIGIIARMFTVPVTEHEDMIDKIRGDRLA